MRILIVGNKISSVDKITNYTDMWSFYLSRSLVNNGIEIEYYSPFMTSQNEFIEGVLSTCESYNIDAILALGVRYFSKLPQEVGHALSTKFKGLVCQIHDASLLDGAPIDVNFTVRDDRWRYISNENNRLTRHERYNYHIGWAADSEIFYPEQKGDVLKVFVDHSTFTDTAPDYTLNIMMSLIRLRDEVNAGKHLGFKSLEVKTLTDAGLEIVDLEKIVISPYNRKAVPLTEFSEALRSSHLFIVTHNESVGLTVLEAAYCGAYLFVPEGTINPDRLKCVKHSVFKGHIDWRGLHEKIQPEINSNYVKEHNWDNVAFKLLKGLIDMNKR